MKNQEKDDIKNIYIKNEKDKKSKKAKIIVAIILFIILLIVLVYSVYFYSKNWHKKNDKIIETQQISQIEKTQKHKHEKHKNLLDKKITNNGVKQNTNKAYLMSHVKNILKTTNNNQNNNKNDVPNSNLAKTINKHLAKKEIVMHDTNKINTKENSTHIEINIIKKDQQIAQQSYKEAMKQQNNSKKILALQQIIKKYPKYNQARLSLIALLIKDNKLTEATNLIKIGLKNNNDNAKYALLLAHILVENQQMTGAINILKKYQPSDLNNHKNYYALLAALFLHHENYNDAKNIYTALVKLYPNNSKWWFGLGISLQQLGRVNNARTAFAKADQLNNLPAKLQLYINQELH